MNIFNNANFICSAMELNGYGPPSRMVKYLHSKGKQQNHPVAQVKNVTKTTTLDQCRAQRFKSLY